MMNGACLVFMWTCLALTVMGQSAQNPKDVGGREYPNGDKLMYVEGLPSQNGVSSIGVIVNPVDKKDFVYETKTTDGVNTMVKFVLDKNGNKLDCNVINDEKEVEEFVRMVRSEIQINKAQSMTTGLPMIPAVFYYILLDVPDQASKCQEFIQGRISENPPQFEMNRANAPALVEIEDQNEMEETDAKHRQKRGYLLWPGTNWCGKGSKAEYAQSYGENVETDKCCQKHDQCPYVIEGFSTKYNLFNYRVHTLSICDCDDKFLNCLKTANTTTSAMVGKVYFNVVNTECFDLKLQKTCGKRSWWGGCEKYTTKWVAAVRSMGKFPE